MAGARQEALFFSHALTEVEANGDLRAVAYCERSPGPNCKLLGGILADNSDGLVAVAYAKLSYALESGQLSDNALETLVRGTGGNVVARYGPLNEGPLSADIARTFRSSTHTEVITTEPTKLYRVIFEDGNSTGGYWTKSAPTGPLQSVIDSALDQNWGNTATCVVEMNVPPGTKLFEGSAAEQRGLVGGGNQVYFDKNINPIHEDWIIK